MSRCTTSPALRAVQLPVFALTGANMEHRFDNVPGLGYSGTYTQLFGGARVYHPAPIGRPAGRRIWAPVHCLLYLPAVIR